MLDKEITSGVRNTEWVKYVKTIVDYHNTILPRLSRDRKRPMRNPNDIAIRFNRNSNYLIKSGTVVRRLLDAPVEFLGNRLQGKFRKTDIR